VSAPALRAALVDLHRAILAAERVTLERIHGRLGGAEFLQIAADDPKLAWLAPLSELIVALDEAEAGAEEAEDPEALIERARQLVAPPDPGTPFGRRYLSLLQRSPEVVVAHRAATQAFGPAPGAS
jgi:hypothetical protein